jgi:HEPN domain-containing protein
MPPESASGPPQDPRVHTTREWLRKASTDLAVSQALAHDPQFASAVAFHAQQAAEKALKAFLAWHDVPFRRTHNIGELLTECAVVEPSLASLSGTAAGLTAYAVDTRYPGWDPTPEEAREARRIAQNVLDVVRTRVPPEAIP